MTGKVKTVKIRKQAPLAQGIERSAPDRKAAGSNPVGCIKVYSNKKPLRYYLSGFLWLNINLSD